LLQALGFLLSAFFMGCPSVYGVFVRKPSTCTSTSGRVFRYLRHGIARKSLHYHSFKQHLHPLIRVSNHLIQTAITSCLFTCFVMKM